MTFQPFRLAGVAARPHRARKKVAPARGTKKAHAVKKKTKKAKQGKKTKLAKGAKQAKKTSNAKKPVQVIAAAPLPNKLLKGHTYFVVGNFGHPAKASVVELLKQQGAKVASQLSTNVNAIIIGDGRASAEQNKSLRQAKAWSNSGEADIEVVEDVLELFPWEVDQLRATFSHQASLKNLIKVLENNWLAPYFDLSGSEFNNMSVGCKGAMLYLNAFCMDRCEFVNATVTNLYFYDEVVGLSFQRSTLTDVWMLHAKKPTFHDVTAKRFKVKDAQQGAFTNCDIDGWNVRLLTKCRLQDVHVQKLETDAPSRAIFDKTEFKNCEFKKAKLQNATFVNCTLEDCVFEGGLLHQVRFEKCTLRRVRFQNVKIKAVEFPGSDLQDVQWSGGTIVGMGLATSKLSEIRMDNCKPKLIRVTPRQVDSLSGLNASSVTPSVDSRAAKQIATAMLNASEFTSVIMADVRGTPLTMTISKNWYSQKFFWTVGANQSDTLDNRLQQGNWRRKLTRADVLLAFDWLSIKARGGVPDLRSITVKSAGLSLSTKEAKQLLTELWSEIFQVDLT